MAVHFAAMALLPHLSAAMWMDYSDAGFESMKESWPEKLVVALFFDRSTKSVDIDSFKSTMDEIDPNNTYIKTQIQCPNSSICQQIPKISYPSVILMPCKYKHYWKIVPNNIKSISNEINTKIIINPSKSEYSQLIQQTLKGGSLFHLKVPTLDHELYSIFITESISGMLFGSNFVVTNGSNRRPSMVVYLSPTCVHSFDDLSYLSAIIRLYRIGHFGKIDFSEWSERNRSASTLVLFVQNADLEGKYRKILEVLSNEVCYDYRVGWASILDSMDIANELRKGDNKPSISVVEKRTDCLFSVATDFDISTIVYYVKQSAVATECWRYPLGSTKPIKAQKERYPIVLAALLTIVASSVFYGFSLRVRNFRDEEASKYD